MASGATDGTIAAVVFVQYVMDHGQHVAASVWPPHRLLPNVVNVAM